MRLPKIQTIFASNLISFRIWGHLRNKCICLHLSASASMTFWVMSGTLLYDISNIIAAVPSWNQVYSHSIRILAAFQGWINDSAFTIVEIPYFGLDATKFVFNILINFFAHNLRAIRCGTTNNYCCSSGDYWYMKCSASFEISMKWPVITFIFGNDWWMRGSIVTSNEKRSLIRGWNRVMRITP